MPAPLEAGATLGRYELLLPIAQGGMAQVWSARLKGTRGFSKTVAVKTMLPMLSADPRFEKMFLSEAEIAARIKHPNVCEILDLGEHDGVLYLVMEWIDGEPLVTLASDCEDAGRPIPHEVSARLVRDAAKGLHAAHELRDDDGALVGVVHRDVSPHNILVTAEGIVKIVDFGVAKAVARADHQATSTGHLKGKVQYMSPEQAFCDDIDRRADIFALGIVLYHLTTGVHPFRTDNELATLARITSPDPVKPAEQLVPGLSPVLARVIGKALAKDKDDRYATMDEFAQDLDGALAALGSEGHAVSAEAFVRDALSARAKDRAAALKAAARAADDRALKTSSSTLPRATDLGAVTGAPVMMAPAVSSGRNVAIAAAGFGIAVGLGVVALLWSTRGATIAPSADTAAAALTPAVRSVLAPAASTRSSAAEPSVVPAGTADSSAPVPASVAPSASASAPKPSPSSSSSSRSAPRGGGPVKPAQAPKAPSSSNLRSPGF